MLSAQKLSRFVALVATILALLQQSLNGYLYRLLCRMPLAVDQNGARWGPALRPLFCVAVLCHWLLSFWHACGCWHRVLAFDTLRHELAAATNARRAASLKWALSLIEPEHLYVRCLQIQA